MCIEELIPKGSENAISRTRLVQEAVRLGIVTEFDSDRQVRRMISEARDRVVILNLSDGKGYFRPSLKDERLMDRHYHQEYSRALTSLKRLKLERKLIEDFKHGRITD